MQHTARRIIVAEAIPMSGIRTVRPPRGGWHREDPATGEGSSGGGPGGSGNGDDNGKAGDDADSNTPKIKGDFDPERAAADLGKAREDTKKAKQAAKEAQDRVAAILKAAGLTQDGKQDPEEQLKELAARADAAEKRATELVTRDAVRTAAAKHNGDAEQLLDSRSFAGKLADLDTTAADFGDKVADLVKAEVKANPRYASQSTGGKGAGKQGADHSGASGKDTTKPKNLTEAIAARLGGQ